MIGQDATRAKRITIRAGYRYKRSLNTEVPVNENRPTAEFTLRWVFPEGVLMSNRARGEFRFVNGAFSWRYRDLLKFEKDFHMRDYAFTAYTSAEPSIIPAPTDGIGFGSPVECCSHSGNDLPSNPTIPDRSRRTPSLVTSMRWGLLCSYSCSNKSLRLLRGCYASRKRRPRSE